VCAARTHFDLLLDDNMLDEQVLRNEILSLVSNSAQISDSKARHRHIAVTFAGMAPKYGCIGQVEYEQPYLGKNTSAVRRGRIDCVWLHDGAVVVALEIDWGFRRKSIAKLRNSQAEHNIWIVPIRPKADVAEATAGITILNVWPVAR